MHLRKKVFYCRVYEPYNKRFITRFVKAKENIFNQWTILEAVGHLVQYFFSACLELLQYLHATLQPIS